MWRSTRLLGWELRSRTKPERADGGPDSRIGSFDPDKRVTEASVLMVAPTARDESAIRRRWRRVVRHARDVRKIRDGRGRDEHARAATVMLFRLEHRNTAYVTLGRISAMIRSFLVGNLLMGIFMGLVSTVVFGIFSCA